MGIRNMSRNESTKLNDPDIPQQSLHLQQHITGVLDSSKILVRRAKEHKICLKVISIIKWEKLFFPYYKCLYTIRPREGENPSNLGSPFSVKCLAQPLSCCEINSWEVLGSGPIIFCLASTQYTQELSTSWADSGLPVQHKIPGKLMWWAKVWMK